MKVRWSARSFHFIYFHALFTFSPSFSPLPLLGCNRVQSLLPAATPTFEMPPSLSRSSRDSHNPRRSFTTLPSRFSCSHDSSVKSIFMSKNKQTDILRALKALRRSIKGEKEGKIQHVSIAPKSALAIVPPKKVRQTHFTIASGGLSDWRSYHAQADCAGLGYVP